MKVLIVAQDASVGNNLRSLVEVDAIQAQVFLIETVEGTAIDWTKRGGRTNTLTEALAEADYVILSHGNGDVAREMNERVSGKPILNLFSESAPLPVSSLPLSWFPVMWPDIAKAIGAKFKADS